MSIEILHFNKRNPQEDYKYMAEDLDGNYQAGYIIRHDKDYYIAKEIYYINDNFDGTASFDMIAIKPNTIIPFTQIAHIRYNQLHGIDTQLVKNLDDSIIEESVITIKVKDKMPYELWDNKTGEILKKWYKSKFRV